MSSQQELPFGTLRDFLEEKNASTAGKPAAWSQLVALKEKLERKYHVGFDSHVFREQIRQSIKRRFAA